MKKLRHTLKWVRRAVLAAFVLAFALSFVGIFSITNETPGNDEHIEINSLNGMATYLRVYTKNGPKSTSAWRTQFISLLNGNGNEAAYFYGSFHWNTLGFHFVSREAAISSTGQIFFMLNIVLPYWPFLLALLLPEVWPWFMRNPNKTIQSAPEIAIDAKSSIIARDLPCVQCGYNLRGLPDTGRCPECGLSTASTLSLNKELAKSRPAWLRRLAAANWLLLITRILLVGAYANAFSACFLTPYMQNYELAAVFLSAMSVMYVAGIFLMTGNEHPYLRSPDRKLASMQRILAVASLISIGLGVSYQEKTSSFSRSLDRWEPQTVMLLVSGIVLYCICVILEFRFLAKLAGRLLDRFMVEHCMIAGIGACLINVLVLWLAPAIAHPHGIPNNSLPMMMLVVLVALWLLFLIWTSFMNVYCAVRFTGLARQAAQRWQSQTAR